MIETQYIDLFTQHRDLIDSKSANVLNSQRDKALEVFKKIGFPNRQLEDFQYSDVANEFIPDFGININRFPVKVDPYQTYKCNVPELATNLFFLLNDGFHGTNLPKMNFPAGVFIGSLNDFAEQHTDICAKYYGKITKLEKNGVAAFNTMFAQDGFVVYVPDNTVIEQPIQLINILTANADYLVNRRILIIAGKMHR